MAAISTIAPQNCTECMSLYNIGKQTYLQCGHRLPVASLAHNNQGSPKLDTVFVNNHPVDLLMDSGSSVLGTAGSLVSPKNRTGEVIKCVTFGGTVEKYDLCNVQIEKPYISGRIQALILPRPITQLIVGNILGIKSPTPTETEEWNMRHGFGKSSDNSIRQPSCLNQHRPGRRTNLVDNIQTGMSV